MSGLDADDRALLERRRKVLGGAYRLFYDQPLHPQRGEGVWLYDRHDRAYLDAYNNVACLGHCHPQVVAAISRQAARLNTHTRYLDETILDCAERLLATLPPPLAQVIFTCTGSEANDLAYRIACQYTGARGLIVTRMAYHGVTQALAQASPSLGAQVPLGRHVRTVELPGAGDRDGLSPAQRFAAQVQRAVDELAAAGIRPAALLLDSVFASDGIFTDPAGFIAPAVEVIHRAGGLFIADEVQAGLARLGEPFWGFVRHRVSPDIVTLGKPFGNGHPVAAVVARRECMEAFGQASRYFNTFGGNPVSCAAALAVLDVIEREGIPGRVEEVGEYLRRGLGQLAALHPEIGQVRGAGLFIAVAFASNSVRSAAAIARAVVEGMRERGVLLSLTGAGGDVLKIRPPLVFERQHADILIERLDQTLTALRAGPTAET
ncbi:aspartate aminotransferase family protein [Halotalea alkalilenta]|uniref:aspartate aminotransferase family protein n=1 Tax=Halotalea alkalilenta TaxID=376489 RepID=UPI0005BE86DE|nr:aspartate aminotransferase family protein [Halotalea alkalilenta]